MYHKRTFEMIFEPANGICMQNMNRLLSLKASAKIRGEMQAKNGEGGQIQRYTGSEQSVRKGLDVLDVDKLATMDFCFYNEQKEVVPKKITSSVEILKLKKQMRKDAF